MSSWSAAQPDQTNRETCISSSEHTWNTKTATFLGSREQAAQEYVEALEDEHLIFSVVDVLRFTMSNGNSFLGAYCWNRKSSLKMVGPVRVCMCCVLRCSTPSVIYLAHALRVAGFLSIEIVRGKLLH